MRYAIHAMAKRRRLRRMGLFALGIALAYVFGCWTAARGYLRPRRNVVVAPAWVQTTTVPTKDGPDPAWIAPGFEHARVVFVLAHGYGGGRQTWSEMMKEFEVKGWGAVAPCMPGQDASPAPEVGFGKLEAVTIVETVAWVRKTNPRAKVILMGMSLGGSACWMASELDPSVDAVISDSAFARFDEAMNTFFDRRLPGGRFIFQPVIWMARRMSGLDPYSIVPMDSAAKWKKPALVIQGLADDLVLMTHGDRLAKAAHAELWQVHGAGHVESFDKDPKAYMAHLAKFIAKIETVSR